jgi:hypothetical protein
MLSLISYLKGLVLLKKLRKFTLPDKNLLAKPSQFSKVFHDKLLNKEKQHITAGFKRQITVSCKIF